MLPATQKTKASNYKQSNTRKIMGLTPSVYAILTAGLLVTGCIETGPTVAVDEPDPDLNFVRGYRSASDPCQLTGETSFTIDFLDDSADLVSCPTGDPASNTLLSENNAVVVTQTESFTLYSVRRGQP